MSISNNQQLGRRLKRVESPNVTYIGREFPIFWERAAGCFVWDAQGKRYLDLTSAFGVASLGHNSSVVLRAIKAQTQKLWHGMGDVHPSQVKIELLEELARITPGALQKTILSSSGAEAVESALKTAYLATRKPGVLAFEGGYHGLTYGALSATHRSDFRKPFGGQMSRFVVHAPYSDLDAVEHVFRKKGTSIGAILVEPMQARGGIRIPDPFYLKELQKIGRRFGALLIADEIYTGFGRTGKPFGVDHSGVVPDLMCLGKAMANGYPISACIGTAKVMNAWPESNGEAIHTSTFLGNPLGCAMALASIREFRTRKLWERSRQLGSHWLDNLRQGLENTAGISDIRGVGLMVGVEFRNGRHCSNVVKKLLRKGIVVLSSGQQKNVLSLTPPLTIAVDQMENATELLRETIKEVMNNTKG